MRPRAPLPFRPLASLRSHEEVADQLRRHIALRLVGPTGALPPERDLARLFRVGRATVQRALALLELEGLVERRRGRAGGTFVVAHVGDPAPRLVEALRRDRRRIEEALAFRLTVEPAAAALAALVRTDADADEVARAAAAAAAAETARAFEEHDTAFHLAIARAARNTFFLDAVERLRLVLNDALAALPSSAGWHAWSNEEHERVRGAIAARDAETARDAMAAHVLHADDALRTLLASLEP